jgi:tetratricopeptide (TPR) repeat protein
LNSIANPEAEIQESLEAAQRSVGLDARDATGHWSHGRALFLSRQHDSALDAIDRALTVKPSYAQGHYARGFIGIHSGIDDPAVGSLDTAERLSPFDPLLFAMKCGRGISLANQGRYDEALREPFLTALARTGIPR